MCHVTCYLGHGEGVKMKRGMRRGVAAVVVFATTTLLGVGATSLVAGGGGNQEAPNPTELDDNAAIAAAGTAPSTSIVMALPPALPTTSPATTEPPAPTTTAAVPQAEACDTDQPMVAFAAPDGWGTMGLNGVIAQLSSSADSGNDTPTNRFTYCASGQDGAVLGVSVWDESSDAWAEPDADTGLCELGTVVLGIGKIDGFAVYSNALADACEQYKHVATPTTTTTVAARADNPREARIADLRTELAADGITVVACDSDTDYTYGSRKKWSDFAADATTKFKTIAALMEQHPEMVGLQLCLAAQNRSMEAGIKKMLDPAVAGAADVEAPVEAVCPAHDVLRAKFRTSGYGKAFCADYDPQTSG